MILIAAGIAAAKKVLSSGWKQHWVTAEITYDEEFRIAPDTEYFKLINRKEEFAFRLLEKNCRNFWAKLFPQNYLHDPITLSAVSSDDIIRFEKERVLIDDDGIFQKDSSGFEISLSVGFNMEKFKQLLYERVLS